MLKLFSLFINLWMIWGITMSLFAQAPDVLWTRTFGGIYPDEGYSVQETSDGGYVISGNTYSTGVGYQAWLIKTDSTGNPLWTRTYNANDGSRSVHITSDGGFIVTGSIAVPAAGGTPDVFLWRIDSSGNTIWFKTYGVESDSDAGFSVREVSNGDYIVAGYTIDSIRNSSDVLLIRIDSLGNKIWSKTYGSPMDEDYGYCVREISPAGFIIAGQTTNFSTNLTNVWLIRTDDLGNTIWARTYGGNDNDYGSCALQTSDGGFAVLGMTTSFGPPGLNVWLVRVNNAGDTLWTKTYGFDVGKSFEETSDNGFIITGWTFPDGGGPADLLLVKTDVNGDTLWTKIIGGDLDDYGYSIKQTSDDGYIVTGVTHSYGSGSSDIWLIRLDSESTIPVELSSFTATAIEDVLHLNWITATETNNRGFEVERKVSSQQSAIDNPQSEIRNPKWELVGFVEGFGSTTKTKAYSFTDKNVSVGSYKYRLKQIDFNGSFEYSPEVEVEILSPSKFALHQNYPNPFNPTTKISWQSPVGSWQTLKIYDVLGNEVATLLDEYKPAGNYEVEFEAGHLPSGVYFYRVQLGEFIQTKRLMLLK